MDNFSIFLDNLSHHYLGCVTVSFLAVVMTWWFLPKYMARQPAIIEDKSEDEFDTTTSAEEIDIGNESPNAGLLTRIKIARQEKIEQQLIAGLSEKQLDEEKKTEADQLAAIFSLLSQQEEKFKVNSMEDVQSQMKLYRR